jgi:hypothetical protein
MKIVVTHTIIGGKKDPEYQYIYYSKLSTLDDESCTEIQLNNSLDFLPERDKILSLCLTKLCPGGSLSMIGHDVILISKDIFLGILTIQQGNNLLYNDQKSLDSISKLIVFMRNNNMKIIDKQIENYMYKLKVVK